MKLLMRISLAFIMLCGILLTSGCKFFGSGDSTLVTVKIISIHPYQSVGEDYYQSPHTVVERIATQERNALKGTTWGETGDVFAVQSRVLYQQ